MTASMLTTAAPQAPQAPRGDDLDQLDQEHRLRLVRARARTRVRRRRTIAALAAFGGVACVLLLAVVTAHVAITQNQFRLEKLEAKAVEEQADYERLRLHVAELESPGRIVASAQDRLGMVQPVEVTYLSPDPTPTFAAPRDPPDAPSGPEGRGGPVAATNPAAGWRVVKPHLGER